MTYSVRRPLSLERSRTKGQHRNNSGLNRFNISWMRNKKHKSQVLTEWKYNYTSNFDGSEISSKNNFSRDDIADELVDLTYDYFFLTLRLWGNCPTAFYCLNKNIFTTYIQRGEELYLKRGAKLVEWGDPLSEAMIWPMLAQVQTQYKIGNPGLWLFSSMDYRSEKYSCTLLQLMVK
jgi:hypothetical protein